ncbi:MAG: ferrous iron transport protein B [Campylobacterales bacterium]|nr:ferrous iron transport protein B [Campylobacterales bacterium]
MQKLTIALAGQPNVGKSSLINAISSSRLKVGNFSGVTVEKTEVTFKWCDDISCSEYDMHIIDLPGAYSLSDYTIEEKVTKSFIQSEEYDLIVNVVDATNLQRNLLFTAELLESGKKVVVALNMIDEAQKEGIKIDEKILSEILGAPCIKTSATDHTGIDALKNAIVEVYKKDQYVSKLKYSDHIEEEIGKIVNFFEEKRYKNDIPYRILAIRLLQEESETYKMMHDDPIWIELLPLIRSSLEHIYIHSDSKDIEQIFKDEHFAFAKGAKMEAMEISSMRAKNLTQKIDNILINKFLGIPIFLFFMWGLFQLTFTLGAIPVDIIDEFFASIGEAAKGVFGEGTLGSLIGDGIVPGVGAVVMFLPNIIILFIGIALLETTGYMSRVAFLLDGFFHRFGLHGKSFIPLVTGFGCSVPAYMAARTLKNERERLITLFIIGFMSCGARLPVYVLFVGAFFSQEHAGSILFFIYISGALFGLVAAKVLKTFVFRGENEPFVMEMPKYRLPSLRLIWHTVYSQAKSYLKKAGTFILAASMLIWFASNYPKNETLAQEYQVKIEQATSEQIALEFENEFNKISLENSYLGKTGYVLEPFFEPLGFDWRMSIAIATGLAAKEVVVSTMGVLYSLGGDVTENNQGLMQMIKKEIPFASAISFIVFVMIYLPCLAASMVFVREAGSWKYLVYLFLFTTVTAWIMSFIVYRVVLAL